MAYKVEIRARICCRMTASGCYLMKQPIGSAAPIMLMKSRL
jgi:hypothetical protein